MKERIAYPVKYIYQWGWWKSGLLIEKYIDEGKPTPPEVNIYHSVFSLTML